MYTSEDSDEPPPKKVVEEEKYGYFYLYETHINGEQTIPFNDNKRCKQIREHILTKEDEVGRNMFHIGCLIGGKHFVTMMLFEAQQMNQKLVERLIDKEDDQECTPLYHLCMKGFRPKIFNNDNDWQILDWLD